MPSYVRRDVYAIEVFGMRVRMLNSLRCMGWFFAVASCWSSCVPRVCRSSFAAKWFTTLPILSKLSMLGCDEMFYACVGARS
jgi:hypothetical protein